jgi:hypothetical protein
MFAGKSTNLYLNVEYACTYKMVRGKSWEYLGFQNRILVDSGGHWSTSSLKRKVAYTYSRRNGLSFTPINAAVLNNPCQNTCSFYVLSAISTFNLTYTEHTMEDVLNEIGNTWENWIIILGICTLYSSGQSSWLQIWIPGFDCRHYQNKKK